MTVQELINKIDKDYNVSISIVSLDGVTGIYNKYDPKTTENLSLNVVEAF